jgi:molybdate/tungstate transport system substrate-binding protein
MFGARAWLAGTAALAAFLFAFVPAIGVHAQSADGRLHVCHAGSLTAAFTPIEEAFSRTHSGIEVVDVAGGSVDLARRLASGAIDCDVYAPADHLIVDLLMKPAKLADFTIVFARGRMVLAYMATDPKARALTVAGNYAPPSSIPQVSDDWYTALIAPGVRIAGAHPFLDPGGYRAHMIFELAQAYYKLPGLYNSLLRHYQVNPADPSLPAPALGKDFTFQLTYEHNAAFAAKRDAAYRYARLPPQVDLSSAVEQPDASSSVTIPGLGVSGSPASARIPASMVEWGVTIPVTSRNRGLAVAFLSELLGPVGREALTTNGPAPVIPARVTQLDRQRLPEPLRSLTTTAQTPETTQR